MRCLILMCLALGAIPVFAAEDYRVMKLEQDVRTLEREVQSLQRLVNELQQQARRQDPSYDLNASRSQSTQTVEQKWLRAAAWNEIRDGMSELAVIEILGKPTALRADDNARRVMLYTLEIGATNFLTGSVAFEDGKVREVQKPTLR